MWSLAIEEQVYVLWPLLVLGVGARRVDQLEELAVPLEEAVAGLADRAGVEREPAGPNRRLFLLEARY